MSSKLKLAAAVALSVATLSANATNLYQNPLTVSDTGDYIIKINTADLNASALLQQLQPDQVATLTSAAGSKLLVVNLSLEAAQQLQAHTAVSYVEPDNYQQFYATPELNQGFTLDQNSQAELTQYNSEAYYASASDILKRLGHSEHSPYGVSLVNADKVPEPSVANKTICIIDSGLQVDHRDFNGVPVTGNHSDYSGFWHIDQVEHGTHVAGTVAAIENGTGVVGVIKNGNVNVYVQKLSNGEPDNGIRISHQLEAMEVCANQGADVVTMSFGGANPYNAVNDVIDRLTERGVLFIAAAGNHGRPVSKSVCDAQPTPELKEACENAHKAKHYPASYHNVMSVANLDEQKNKNASSPINDAIEIAAPGTNVLSSMAKPYDLFDLKVAGVNRTMAHIGNTSTDHPDQPLLSAACGPDACVGEQFAAKACLYLFDFRNFDLATPALNCKASGGHMLVMYPVFTGMGPIGGRFGHYFDFPIFSVGNSTGLSLLADSTKTLEFIKTSVRHNFLTGTSMATPHVSAVATKVWSLNPQCSNQQIRKVLQHTAEDIGEAGRDVAFGFGLVDTQAAHAYIQANGCDTPTPVCPDQWYFNQAYRKGEEVTSAGNIYKAKWWSKASDPAQGSSAWELIRSCEL